MDNRVSPGLALSTSNPMDVMARDAIRQYFSTDLRGKAPIGFSVRLRCFSAASRTKVQ